MLSLLGVEHKTDGLNGLYYGTCSPAPVSRVIEQHEGACPRAAERCSRRVLAGFTVRSQRSNKAKRDRRLGCRGFIVLVKNRENNWPGRVTASGFILQCSYLSDDKPTYRPILSGSVGIPCALTTDMLAVVVCIRRIESPATICCPNHVICKRAVTPNLHMVWRMAKLPMPSVEPACNVANLPAAQLQLPTTCHGGAAPRRWRRPCPKRYRNLARPPWEQPSR